VPPISAATEPVFRIDFLPESKSIKKVFGLCFFSKISDLKKNKNQSFVKRSGFDINQISKDDFLIYLF